MLLHHPNDGALLLLRVDDNDDIIAIDGDGGCADDDDDDDAGDEIQALVSHADCETEADAMQVVFYAETIFKSKKKLRKNTLYKLQFENKHFFFSYRFYFGVY